jgi:hypothetical protein
VLECLKRRGGQFDGDGQSFQTGVRAYGLWLLRNLRGRMGSSVVVGMPVLYQRLQIFVKSVRMAVVGSVRDARYLPA